MKKLIVYCVCLIVVLLMASNAFAWRSVRTGKRQFERAWMAYTSLQQEKAKEHFSQSATAFAKALAADPPSKSARFASNLAMAGMSFYFSGRYAESIDAMERAFRKENRVWEANVFIGLSYAREGNEDNALKYMQLYLESLPSQRILSKTVEGQVALLVKDETTLTDAADQIDAATQQQFINNNNLNMTPRSSTPSSERCSGTYWWRKNKAPCTSTGYGLNSP